MVFLPGLLAISCFLVFHTAEGTLKLSTNHQSVDTLTTKNFILNCTYDIEGRHIESVQLSKVIKNEPFPGEAKELVTMYENSSLHIHSPSPDVKYTGEMYGKDKAYLSGVWTRVPEGFDGIYRCKVSSVDSQGGVSSLFSHAKVIGFKTTLSDTVAAIKELQTSEHNLQEWKKWMILGFEFLDRSILETSQSEIYKDQYYIVYKHKPVRVKYAEDFCRARGGYLAELNDYDEWLFVKKFLLSIRSHSNPVMYYFISGRRNFANNKFYWPRIGKWNPAYFYWDKTQPNNYKGMQHCVALDKVYDWRMSDLRCEPKTKDRQGFICEMPKI